jgi:hypothetical protein
MRTMSQALTLNLPDDAYRALLQAGRDRSEPPENVASRLLAEVLSDPLVSLFGCLEYSSPDVADHHDQYIGESILAERDRG